MHPRLTYALLTLVAGIAAPLGTWAAGGKGGAMLDTVIAEPPAIETRTRLPVVPVSFEFATRDEGHELRLTDVHVVIVCPVVGKLFEGVSEGPFLIANVPDGSFEVIASHEGRAQRVALTVAGGEPRVVSIYW